MNYPPRALSITIAPCLVGEARVTVWLVQWNGARRDLTKKHSAWLHGCPEGILDWDPDEALTWLLPALAAAHSSSGLVPSDPID